MDTNLFNKILSLYQSGMECTFISYRIKSLPSEQIPPDYGVIIQFCPNSLDPKSIEYKVNVSLNVGEQGISFNYKGEGKWYKQYRKDIRKVALVLFFRKYNKVINEVLEAHSLSHDYVEYSRSFLDLKNVKVYYNTLPKIIPDMIAFDTEGFISDTCSLVQIAVDERTVYLFTNVQMIFPVLINPTIKKLVFASGNESRIFPGIQNLYDLQYGSESLTTRIDQVFGVKLKKDKTIHQNGWIDPFTDDERDYAISDVIWLLKLYNKDPTLPCRGSIV